MSLRPKTQPARGQLRRSSRDRGFTLVEVMVSLGIMIIGAMAVIGLQQQTIRANSHARQLETGMQIAQTWIERLKQDAFSWNAAALGGTEPTPAIALVNTAYLNRVVTNPDVFQIIPNSGATATASSGFDFRGQDIDLGTLAAQDLHYCASFKPSWVITGRALRVDVRVWWPRDMGQSDMAAFILSNCGDNDGDLSPGGILYDLYHVVYLSTVIGHTRVPR